MIFNGIHHYNDLTITSNWKDVIALIPMFPLIKNMLIFYIHLFPCPKDKQSPLLFLFSSYDTYVLFTKVQFNGHID